MYVTTPLKPLVVLERIGSRSHRGVTQSLVIEIMAGELGHSDT